MYCNVCARFIAHKRLLKMHSTNMASNVRSSGNECKGATELKYQDGGHPKYE